MNAQASVAEGLNVLPPDPAEWSTSVMLQNLSKQVRDCMQRAEESAYRAKIERDPALACDFLEMERRWLSLARSYQFSEQLQSFSNHNKKR